jgi:long-chain acyl-CoA synthetase
METATAPAVAHQTDARTIADLLPVAVADHGASTAVRYKDDAGDWVSKTFDEVGEVVKQLALGLIELGVAKGDKVAILANTRVEWSYFDFAALTVGATVVPIYQTNSAEECQYVLENSDAKVVIVEDPGPRRNIRRSPRRSPCMRRRASRVRAARSRGACDRMRARFLQESRRGG